MWPFSTRQKRAAPKIMPTVRRAPARRARGSGYKSPYVAAETSRLFEDWFSLEISSVQALRQSLPLIRRRSRDLARNNDYMRRFLQIAEDNIVGPAGIRLQVKATDANGVLDVNGNDIIETEFRNWGRKGNATVCHRLSWTQVQRLAVRYMIRDGEAIILKVDDRDSRWGFRLRFIDPEYFDDQQSHDDGELPNGNRRYLGVEVSEDFRPIAYHFRRYNSLTSHGGRAFRVPAKNVIHLYSIEHEDQVRGVPWVASAMTRLNMLGEYEEAELVAARMAAAKMGFYETAEDIPPDGIDPATNEPLLDFEPGVIDQLPPGTKFHAIDMQHPTTAFGDFTKAVLRGAASGIGLSYVHLANDLEGVNYSSIRQGELTDRDHWRGLQGFLSDSLCQPVYEHWLMRSLALNAFNMPIERFDKFNRTLWQPRGWQWVDPEKEVKAAIEAINAGLKTRTQVLAEGGYDFEDTVRQLALEKQMLEDAGLASAPQQAEDPPPEQE